jgi:hydroxymethylglutaryl-CoA synthase
MKAHALKTVGIDDMAAYVPTIYLPIETLAGAHNLEYDKLNKGLGLEAMAVADAREDAATMMANAVRDLIDKNKLDPRSIGRIYLGTESALDGAKPTATYALEMLEAYYTPQYGPDCFLHCDVVDLTFACIGAVDALQNTLDWVSGGEHRMGIVVAADNAKYELGSGGEYTQGAGAVALLVKHQPRLLAIDESWGVATRPVYDFFKPLRKVKRGDLIAEILHLANRNHVDIDALVDRLDASINVDGVIDSNVRELSIHRETPVFDGPYSNLCYQNRIREALEHYRMQAGYEKDEPVATTWDRLAFHLPYAFQARRMFGEIFWQEAALREQHDELVEAIGTEPPRKEAFADDVDYQKALVKFWRAVTKTDAYRQFVRERIAKGERASSLVGNVYTGSLFLAIMSTLETDYAAGTLDTGATLGCFAYGSGSKSKVFTTRLQPQWKEVVAKFGLFARLEERQAIDYPTYEKLHRGQFDQNVAPRPGTFYLTGIHEGRDTREGMRTYAWQPVPQPKTEKVVAAKPATN